jgi:hypothetical protein
MAEETEKKRNTKRSRNQERKKEPNLSSAVVLFFSLTF